MGIGGNNTKHMSNEPAGTPGTHSLLPSGRDGFFSYLSPKNVSISAQDNDCFGEIKNSLFATSWLPRCHMFRSLEVTIN